MVSTRALEHSSNCHLAYGSLISTALMVSNTKECWAGRGATSGVNICTPFMDSVFKDMKKVIVGHVERSNIYTTA